MTLPVSVFVAPTNGVAKRLIVAKSGDVEHRDSFDPFEAWKRNKFIDALAGKLHVSRIELGAIDQAIVDEADRSDVAADAIEPPDITSCPDVADRPARLRTAIIHGLQRQGETANIIAPSKTGKSWLGIGIGLSIAAGIDWLERYPVNQGAVLYIDNELHPETFQHRIETVSRAMELNMHDLAGFAWWNLRGKLCDLHGLARKLEAIEPGIYREIILDAWYRFLPPGVDENDNGAVTQLYNVLDSMAERLKCGFICVHHSSKGNQSGKAITDVGSGAGSQSRACDTHLVLRAHEEEGAYVLDAAVRSFPPIEPIGARFNFPLWSIDESLDPNRLRPEKRRPKKDAAAVETPAIEAWTAERFARECCSDKPRTKDAIIAAARPLVGSERMATGLLALAEEGGHIHRWKVPGSKAAQFATKAQPALVVTPEEGGKT